MSLYGFFVDICPFITSLSSPFANYLHKNSWLCIMMLTLPPESGDLWRSSAKQEELVKAFKALLKKKFSSQGEIVRCCRKRASRLNESRFPACSPNLRGAYRTPNGNGLLLAELGVRPPPARCNLVLDIDDNDAVVVIHTSPRCAADRRFSTAGKAKASWQHRRDDHLTTPARLLR